MQSFLHDVKGPHTTGWLAADLLLASPCLETGILPDSFFEASNAIIPKSEKTTD